MCQLQRLQTAVHSDKPATRLATLLATELDLVVGDEGGQSGNDQYGATATGAIGRRRTLLSSANRIRGAGVNPSTRSLAGFGQPPTRATRKAGSDTGRWLCATGPER